MQCLLTHVSQQCPYQERKEECEGSLWVKCLLSSGPQHLDDVRQAAWNARPQEVEIKDPQSKPGLARLAQYASSGFEWEIVTQYTQWE